MNVVTIVSKKYGVQKMDLDKFNPNLIYLDSIIFKIVEDIFNDWYEYNTEPGAPMARDIEGMYYGEGDQPAIYSKKGAIQQGVENVIEELIESGKKFITEKDIKKMDIECAFE